MRYLIFILFVFPASLNAYYYPTSYLESRDVFVALGEELKKSHPGTEVEALSVPTQTKAHLTMDSLHLPPKGDQYKNLIIVTSGIHGVEAFTGAAIQIEWLKQHLKPEWFETTGFLIVHGVNPYGFHFKRRVDEANVDLNRNMSANEKNFNEVNEDYAAFDSFLNPKVPLEMRWKKDFVLFFQSLIKLVTLGKKKLTQIVVGGQYQNPEGIYFGGKETRPNSTILREHFKKKGTRYANVLHIDLHTGFGKRGTLHLFSDHGVTQLRNFDKIFEGFKVDAASDKDFYRTSGSFGLFTLQVFEEKNTVLPMTFEFGTMDSQTIWGGFMSLRNSIFENQGHQFGYVDEQSEMKIKEDFMNMFNPSDHVWRDQVLKTGTETLTTLVDRFNQL